ncbi:MAG: tryptophanase [Bacteroidetes bacterium]|nr:tryptophanase [Bacteroidota bacterium]
MTRIFEPFRIKSVEPIKFTTKTDREKYLKEAHNNVFLIRAKNVLIDLLTDSGTSAMSAQQWGAIMTGDESYAGAESFYHFEDAVKNIMGFKHVIPTHQGRAAEKIVGALFGGKGKTFVSNSFFDTTRGNIEYSGAEAVDFLTDEGKQPALIADFKGNMNNPALEKYIQERGAENIPMCVLTITNNSGGGQPVSMQNIRETSEVCKKYGILFFIDACRFAENAYFIKTREKGYENKSILEICREQFSYADGCTMSAKKDALVNIGGFICMNDDKLAMEAKNLLIIMEGFPTYGGLAGRDLEAMAQGLKEVLEEDYLEYRIGTMKYIGEKLTEAGVPILKPTGGHAVYLDAKAFMSHIPPHELPGIALTNALYVEGGIRGVEIGSLMFGKYDDKGDYVPATLELVRLAIPRRVYTQSHMDYMCDIIIDVYKKREQYKGYKITYEAPLLRHFTAHMESL